MADIFISYAREDQDFVRKLQEALEEHKRNTWVDWKDIPLTAKWKEEVFSAIDNSDSFAAVISPDFIVSEPCREELDHAAHNNKRMVPLWHRDVADEEVPKELSAHQYVFLREKDDFEDAFERLLEALDMDLGWVRFHTRLLGESKEWEKGGKDPSFLLRGKTLEEAERWQAKEADKEPKLTSEQKEYVLASRQTESKRHRRVLGVGALVLMVVMVLGLLALGAFVWALSNGREAEIQADIALSRQLAAQATEQQESQPDASLLLNVEALQTAPARAEEEARFALLDTLAQPYHISTQLTGHTGWVYGVEFSPDGKLVVTASDDNTVRLWDVPSGEPRSKPLTHTAPVLDVAFSPEGELLASASVDGTVWLWDVATGEPHGAPLTGHTDAVVRVAFSPDGKLLASASADKAVRLWDVATGRPRGQLLTGDDQGVIGVEFSPDGELLATAGYRGKVRLWNIEGEALVSEACRPANRNLSEDEWRWFVGAEFDYERTCPDLPAGPSFPAGYYGAEGLTASLVRGVNVADVFDPAFRFEVGKDWESVPPERTDRVTLGTGPKGGSLLFTNPSYYVYDPRNPGEAQQVPTPKNAEEWVSWFKRHPNLETSNPVPVRVGGASGMRIDVRASSTLEKNSRWICGPKPCVPLYPTSGGPIIATPSDEGWNDRYVIVDVGDETVIINVAPPEDKFGEFLPKAQKVLDSVEWKGG